MIITRRQLKKVIKEEKARLLRELEKPDWKQGYAGGAPDRPGPMTNVSRSRPVFPRLGPPDAYNRLESAIGAAMDELGERQVRDYLEAFVEGY
jgi:hypothetical protein